MSTFRTLAALGTCALLLSCSSPSEEPPAPADAPEGAPAAPAAPIKLGEPTNQDAGFLTAFADADEVVGGVPHTVKLEVAVVEGTGHPPFSYKWDFGDATEFSTDQAPTHVYKIPGSFRASVIVTDSKGETDQDYVDITVNEDFEYAVTPEQMREALPLDDVVEKAKKKAEAANGAAPPAAAPNASK
jgi:hypothetical protein